MNVTVNGRVDTLAEGCTVSDVVCAVTGTEAPRGVAVALNGEVVTRTAWSRTGLAEGDRVEVLTAVQGG